MYARRVVMEKELESQIKIFIAEELKKGTSLSDIQNMVNEKFSQKMTYMDIRIMASALDVDWRALDPAANKVSAAAAEEAGKVEESNSEEESGSVDEDIAPDCETASEAGNAASTVVEVSPIARPGMMFSGSVKFASGSTADWYVDSMGRLGVENLVGEKPDKNDIEQFQIELDKAVRKMMGQ